MAAIVKPVPDDDMLLKEMATSSNSIVSRRRVFAGATTQGPFSYKNNPYGSPAKVTFDIMEAESFLDLRTLLFQAIMYPQFYRRFTTAPSSPTTAADAAATGYMKGSGPELDRSIDSLLVTLRIGNSQGLIIEQHDNYGNWCAILNSHNGEYKDSEHPLTCTSMNYPANQYYNGGDTYSSRVSSNQANYLTSAGVDDTASSVPNAVITPTNAGGKVVAQRNLLIPFTGSSFLNRIKLLPMFLLRSGLRIELEFEDPRLAFFNNCGFDYVGPVTLTTNTLATPTQISPINQTLFQNDIVLITHTQDTLITTAVGSLTGGVSYANNPLGLPIYSAVVSPATLSAVAAGGTGIAFAAALTTSFVFPGTTTIPLTWAANTGGTMFTNYYGYVLRPKSISLAAAAFSNGFNMSNIVTRDVPVEGTSGGPFWSYGITNPQLICDFIKPSSEIYQEYLNRFQMPEGIPYAYDRVLYQQISITNPVAGVTSLPLNFAVRSLKGIVLVLQDPIADAAQKSSYVQLNFPCKSAFMLRGLRSANLQIGAQQYPAYTMNFGNDVANQLLVESGLLMGSFSKSMDSWAEDRYGTDYARCQGVLGAAAATGVVNAFDGIVNYKDTRSAVIGFSTMKKDNGFLQGVDTTQSGNIILNLNFSPNMMILPCTATGNPPTFPRAITVKVYAIADAVFSIQKDSNAVRY
jgi:hypothetical protein